MSDSFLWFDLETFGRSPRQSRIAQFAGIRTDSELNLIGEPISLFCKPADDFLPEPEAAMITGITPQYAFDNGLCEADFMAQLNAQFSQPHTCALGYNSLRFDDEFIRFGFYRNFYDAYEREYAGGNSRWDLLDVMRSVYALQPDALHWPLREDGQPSFKLEHLAKANDCFEGEAHEALSDVRSLVNLARKIKNAAPGLWSYALTLRDKNLIADKLEIGRNRRILHVSGQFPTQQACTGLMLPLMLHPQIKTRTVAVELREPALKLLDYTPEHIERNLFTARTAMPEGELRIGIKEIHHNRCPIVFDADDMKPLGIKPDVERLQLDIGKAMAIQEQLQAGLPQIREKLLAVFGSTRTFDDNDPDAALYSGFFDRSDKAKFSKARTSKGQAPLVFNDARLSELYFRYRARNWPETLDARERDVWLALKKERISDSTLAQYLAECDTHIEAAPDKKSVLDALKAWAIAIER